MCIIDCGLHSASQSPYLYTFKEPRIRFHGIDSVSLCSLAVGIDSWALSKVYKFGLWLHRLAESIPGLLKRSQIRALVFKQLFIIEQFEHIKSFSIYG